MKSYSFNSKSIFTFGLIFISLIVIYLFTLYISALFPSGKIQTNIKESVQIINDQRDWVDPFVFSDPENKSPFTIDIGADAIVMNMIYCMDSKSPFKSILLNKFYGKSDFYDCMPNLTATVNGNAPTEYMYGRYWHGYIAAWRPLFTFFNYLQIRAINFFVFSLLVFLLIIFTTKKLGYFLTLALSLSLAYINFWCIPMAFLYIPAFYLALISSLIIVYLDKQKEIFYLKLFFIIASLTAFFDFLTVPLITFGIPFLFILIKHEAYIKKQSFKQIFVFLFKLGLCWILGFILTWLMKIIIVAAVDKSIIFDSINQVQYRMNGVEAGNSFLEVRYVALYRNLKAMFFQTNPVQTLIILLFVISTWIVFRKKEKFSPVFYIYILLSAIPYLWYALAAEHSIMHCSFTYRLQMITLLSLLLAYKDSIDMEKLKSSFTMLREKIFTKKTIKQITDI